MSAKKNVIGFYGHRSGAEYGAFSNFYRSAKPFKFSLPAYARPAGFPTSIMCEFSEKAIMAVKAALMKDKKSFDQICNAGAPASCKSLGRKVKGFDVKLWEKHLEETAFEVVHQKFAADASLKALLLSTGDDILAEATRNDCIWGIGINVGDARVQDPKKWLGRNVLGYALMRARDTLRNTDADQKKRRASEGSDSMAKRRKLEDESRNATAADAPKKGADPKKLAPPAKKPMKAAPAKAMKQITAAKPMKAVMKAARPKARR